MCSCVHVCTCLCNEVQSILGYLNPFILEGVQISESSDNLTVKTILLAHCNLWVHMALAIAHECFITSHQHQETMSSSWFNYMYKLQDDLHLVRYFFYNKIHGKYELFPVQIMYTSYWVYSFVLWVYPSVPEFFLCKHK